MNEPVDRGIKEYIEKVGAHLGKMPDSERAELLENIESHIRLCLQLLTQKKNQTEASVQAEGQSSDFTITLFPMHLQSPSAVKAL